MAFADGEHKSREPGIDTGVDFGAGVEKGSGGFAIAFGGGPHEGGLVAAGFRGIDVCAGGDEGAHGFDLPGAGGKHEHRFAAGECAIGVGAGFEQDFHHRAIPVDAGLGERRDAEAVGGFGVCASLQKAADGIDIIPMDSPVEVRGAIGIGGGDYGNGD